MYVLVLNCLPYKILVPLFTLNICNKVEGNQVNHFGFQVEMCEEIEVHQLRLKKDRFFAREEMDITCCYAVQVTFSQQILMVTSGSCSIPNQGLRKGEK